MRRGISMALMAALSLTVLLTGCSGREQVKGEAGNSSAAQVETTPSSKAAPSSRSEAGPIDPEGSISGTMSESQAMEGTTHEEEDKMQMNVQVGASTFTATLEENEAVDALVERMEQGPVTIQMSDYGGFEKVGPLGTSLPASNQQTTTQAGDIVLYQGDQIVIFYGANSWSYTRLGRIDDLAGWEEALGSGDVTVTFSLED